MKTNRRPTPRFDMYRRAVASLSESSDLRLDANETALFARQLEDIDAELYRVEYPEHRGRIIVPVKTNISEGAEEYTYRAMNQAGQSKVIANYSTDLPRVDVQGLEVTQKLFGHGASYGYSIQDLRRSRMSGLPFDRERAITARFVVDQKNDKIIAHGESSVGVTGFWNSTLVSLVVPATGSWATASAEEIADDLFLMERTIMTDSSMVEVPDTVVLPPTLFGLASTKRLANTEATALEFFLRKSLAVKNAEWWHEGELADAAGTGPRIAMGKRDPRKVCALLPLEFHQMPPEQRGLGFVINCDSRAGGVIFRYPKSWRYMDDC